MTPPEPAALPAQEPREPQTEAVDALAVFESGDLIEVAWHDSERVALGWTDAAEYVAALNDRTLYRTAGYFVGRTLDDLMVALSRSERGMYNDAICIPVVVVVEVHRISR